MISKLEKSIASTKSADQFSSNKARAGRKSKSGSSSSSSPATVWQCDHCAAAFFHSRSEAVAHEAKCVRVQTYGGHTASRRSRKRSGNEKAASMRKRSRSPLVRAVKSVARLSKVMVVKHNKHDHRHPQKPEDAVSDMSMSMTGNTVRMSAVSDTSSDEDQPPSEEDGDSVSSTDFVTTAQSVVDDSFSVVDAINLDLDDDDRTLCGEENVSHKHKQRTLPLPQPSQREQRHEAMFVQRNSSTITRNVRASRSKRLAERQRRVAVSSSSRRSVSSVWHYDQEDDDDLRSVGSVVTTRSGRSTSRRQPVVTRCRTPPALQSRRSPEQLRRSLRISHRTITDPAQHLEDIKVGFLNNEQKGLVETCARPSYSLFYSLAYGLVPDYYGSYVGDAVQRFQRKVGEIVLS